MNPKTFSLARGVALISTITIRELGHERAHDQPRSMRDIVNEFTNIVISCRLIVKQTVYPSRWRPRSFAGGVIFRQGVQLGLCLTGVREVVILCDCRSNYICSFSN